MIIPTLRQLDQFKTTDIDELARQLSHFEDNVAEAFREAAHIFTPRLAVTNKKTANYVLKPGEAAVADSSAASVTMTLPIARAGNEGTWCAIVRISASNTVTVNVVSGLVDGVASETLPATTRVYLYLSTGEAWWRVGA